MSPKAEEWPTRTEGAWSLVREAIRLQYARWLRLDPTYNELEAALDKAAAEIIALQKLLREARYDAWENMMGDDL